MPEPVFKRPIENNTPQQPVAVPKPAAPDFKSEFKPAPQLNNPQQTPDTRQQTPTDFKIEIKSPVTKIEFGDVKPKVDEIKHKQEMPSPQPVKPLPKFPTEGNGDEVVDLRTFEIKSSIKKPTNNESDSNKRINE